ncbi:MAG: hypothetical protein COS82_10825 [Zetaproteobacteria bacterium CG06_land_8_20_14_3_00_59_53]|nr:MAG: hypothetical protein COX56_04020 [Zetaproteobacteria bacterium CG23_combo_of_CG06-09_8_20_14_all_59_86]PIQ65025.1 MAG: hypothetical protein COV97_06455 [Zetaproteobacteria bacterium CG11_big_fil_rev_8_21_14_0_20_59_439]PIU69405.1 MAG: hypothetical protein COS82_10825 [Zetaproteobacteria bacterium CG06_land_8_20_14_3_00_59_53]PIU96843.1 MAG: hypothetical protein COS62_07575 [Zetaproteobacteria bacterium CG03_land_8_20_14_0_80_59_51]PIY46734.1 MAG: hypothetical protein COZ02_03775 [Zetapr
MMVILVCAQTPVSASELHITATLPALGQIAQGVAGKFGEVKVLAHIGQDPHFVPPKPTLARHLTHADLLIAAGLGLEIGWLPPLLEAAGNDNIRPGGSGYLDGTQVLAEVLGKPQGKITRALGDIHPEGNPHWYIDPINAVRLAQALAERLAVLDPGHAVVFRQNAANFARDVQARMPGWQTALQDLSPLVSYHDSYLYLVQRFGLKVIDFVEPKPGIEPSTAHLDMLVGELQKGSATTLWMEPYHDGKTARKVCELGHILCRVMPDSIQGDGFAGYLHLIDVIAAGGR